jgi:hypothetical protein
MDWKLIREAVTKYRHQFAPDHILETRLRVYSPLITNRARQYERLTSALEEIEKEIRKEREK